MKHITDNGYKLEVNGKPKQETLEEAAERIRHESFICCRLSKSVDYVTVAEREKSAFIKGFEWKQENSYSEEDLKNAFSYYYADVDESKLNSDFKEWLKQFKNK